jgi:hypothetical protein
MSRDLRAYSRQTTGRLVIGFLVLLFIVGDGLIYYFYGSGAAVMGLLCLVGATAPILLIWLIMRFLEWIVRQSQDR